MTKSREERMAGACGGAAREERVEGGHPHAGAIRAEQRVTRARILFAAVRERDAATSVAAAHMAVAAR